MEFTQICFIRKNTPELKSKIIDLGYSSYFAEDYNNNKENYIIACKDNKFYIMQYIPTDSIDCGENEDLFLALAALRDDSDYMQFFTDDTEFTQCFCDSWKDEWQEEYYNERYIKWRKATAEELIEHFT